MLQLQVDFWCCDERLTVVIEVFDSRNCDLEHPALRSLNKVGQVGPEPNPTLCRVLWADSGPTRSLLLCTLLVLRGVILEHIQVDRLRVRLGVVDVLVLSLIRGHRRKCAERLALGEGFDGEVTLTEGHHPPTGCPTRSRTSSGSGRRASSSSVP